MHYKKDTINDFSLISRSNANGTSPIRDREGSQRFPVSNGTSPVRSREILQRESASNGMTNFSITLSKKCERLATAIYLVTNFLSDTEPMKARLRILSLDFVRDASLLKNGSRTIEVSVLDALRANISETLSLLELALVAGLVSEMNFTLLKREYISLRDMVDTKKSSHESLTDNVLGDNFFGSSFYAEEDISAPSPLLTPRPVAPSSLRGSNLPKQSSVPAPIQHSKFDIPYSTPRMSDNKTKGQEVSLSLRGTKQSSVSESSVPHARAITDDADSAESRLGQQSHVLDASVSIEARLLSRRASILKLIKDNKEVAIGDIVNHFPDLSEKTIQRELVTMSDSGVLKKTGERRWSRYSLV